MIYRGQFASIPCDVRQEMRFAVSAQVANQPGAPLVAFCYHAAQRNGTLVLTNCLIDTSGTVNGIRVAELEEWTNHVEFAVGGTPGTWYWTIRPLEGEELAHCREGLPWKSKSASEDIV